MKRRSKELPRQFLSGFVLASYVVLHIRFLRIAINLSINHMVLFYLVSFFASWANRAAIGHVVVVTTYNALPVEIFPVPKATISVI